jgi:predicted Rossmann fold nucleotide-binding protein DprA/Smf involved in DNA uptake
LNLENFSEDEKLIIKSIEIEPKKFDIIASETGINLDTLLVNLTSLELVGIIKQIDGEKYQLI